MKNERLIKSFSASSFDRNWVTRAKAPAPSALQPRLTPESVQHFDVRQNGYADGHSPLPERSGTARRRPRRIRLPVEFRQVSRLWLALPISRGCPGLE
jgi:hypothetical protein